MVVSILGGVACLGVWIVLAFVVAIPSGWVHLPLAVGVGLIARGLVLAQPPGAQQDRGRS
jgi:hypothetical protein